MTKYSAVQLVSITLQYKNTEHGLTSLLCTLHSMLIIL